MRISEVPENVVIIGSGPAGWTAAIYAARAALEPLVIEGEATQENIDRGRPPLGQLALTTEVENYPGFPFADMQAYLDSAIGADLQYLRTPPPEGGGKHAVTGPDLMLLMKQQAINFGTRVVGDDVVDIDVESRPFKLTAKSGEVTEAHCVILATGASANYLGLPSEETFKNRGVSACAVCDGALPRFRDRPLVVVGGGDSAVEEADYLSKFGSKVYIIHRRDKLRASKIMAQRAMDNPKLEILWNKVVADVLGDEKVSGVRLKDTTAGTESTLEVGGLFMAIGHQPATAFLEGQLDLDDKKYITLKDPYRSTTSVDGVFAAGDCVDSVYRQAVTAAGMGCKAAIDAERWLAEQGVE